MNNSTSLNFDVFFFQTLPDPYWRIELGSRTGDTTLAFVNKTVRFCEMERAGKNNYILQLILNSIRSHTNLAFKCPICKGYYYFRNISFTTEKSPVQMLYNTQNGMQFSMTGYLKERRMFKKLLFINFILMKDKVC